MERKVGAFEFDDQDLNSILRHARILEGRTLAKIAEEAGSGNLTELKGKGAAGQLLQGWFAIDPNDNRDEPDLPSVRCEDGSLDVEIKAVPLKRRKRAGTRVKERCKVTNIDYFDLLSQTWETSRARHKLTGVIFVFYDYAGSATWQQSVVRKIIFWRLETSSNSGIIKADWQRTWNAVEAGRAHLISERDAAILGTSTAGAGRDSRDVQQPKSPELARKRAFSLKPAFLQTTFEAEFRPALYRSIVTITGRNIPPDFQKTVIEGLNPYVGLTLDQLAARTGLTLSTGKNGVARLIRKILGDDLGGGRLREIEELGIRAKTVPVREEDLWPLEAMSFPRCYLGDLVDEEWENSELLSDIECLLVIPVLARNRETPKGDRRIAKPFFWAPDPDEWVGIADEWNRYRTQVMKGLARSRAVKRGNRTVRSTRLLPATQTQYIHMRPHSADGTNFDETLPDTKAPVLCFWINQKFMQRVLRRELRNEPEFTAEK